MALAHPLHPIDSRSRNRRRNLWVGWCVSSWWPLFPSRSSVLIYIIYIYMLFYLSSVFYGLPIVSCSLMIEVQYQDGCDFLHFFKQHFDTRYLGFYNPSPPWVFLSLDLLSEYRIQRGAIGPLYVTSSYSSFRLCNWFSLRCLMSWINHLPPACWSTFWKSILNTIWAVGLTCWIIYIFTFVVFWHMQLYMSW